MIAQTADVRIIKLLRSYYCDFAFSFTQWVYALKLVLVMVAVAANVSVDCFHFLPQNMLGNIEQNVNTTNNHPTLMSYFANPSFKKTVLLEIPLASWKR